MKDERRYTVYLLIFPNGKKYIGETSRSPIERWNNGNGYKHSIRVFNAIKKYGWGSVIKEIVLENLTLQEAEEAERDLIKLHKSNQREYGYNISNGGRTTGSLSEETKLKMSQSAMGRVISASTREKLRNCNLGKKQSAETIEKRTSKLRGIKRPDIAALMSKRTGSLNPGYGKKMSEETKRKMSEAGMGNARSAIPVLQFSRQGELIREWGSAKLASVGLKINHSHICECCKGKYKTSGGFIWKHKTKE